MKIGFLQSEKIIIGSLESEKSGPYRSIPGTNIFLKKPWISIYILIKIRTKYTFTVIQIASSCFRVFSMFWNGASARDEISLRKWSAQLRASVRGSISCKKCALLAAMLLFQSCCFAHSINQASNTRLAGCLWTAKLFRAAPILFGNFQKINIYVI